MKTIILTGVLFCLAVIVLPGKPFAQKIEKNTLVDNPFISSQFYSLPAGREHFTETYRSDINIKAVRHFTRCFETAGNENWYKIKDGFFAIFNENGIKTEVYYDKRGYWVYNFLTYHEEQLTVSIKNSVKKKYNDCNILTAYEYQFYDGPVYFVKMKDANIYRTVMIADNRMEVTEQYYQQ